MSYKKYFIFAFFILITWRLGAQAKPSIYSWKVKVSNDQDNVPLIGVNVFDIKNQVGSSTDRNGKCVIHIEKWPVSFEVSYLGYTSKVVTAANAYELPQKILLSQDQNRLSEIVISDKVTPEKVSGKWRSVTDFILIEDKLLYIENGGNYRSSNLVLSTLEGIVLDKKRITDYSFFESLYLSCQETPYILCEYDAIQLNIQNGRLVSEFISKRRDFESLVRPCKASDKEYLYHGTLVANQELAKIAQVDKNTYAVNPLTEVFDEDHLKKTIQSMQLVKLYAHLAKHSSFYADLVNKERADLNTYRKSPDYDVFTVDAQILVMDHEKGKISYFNQSTEHIKDVPIFYNQQKNWTGIVRQDPITENIYIVVEDKNSLILHQLDIETGTLIFLALMDVDMIDKLDVHNGTLWYTSSTLSGSGVGKRLHKLDI